MIRIKFLVIFTMILASFSMSGVWAEDWETYDVLNRLLTVKTPESPIIYEDFVIFTADSSLRRLGVSFSHENFATTYWFKKLVVPNDFNAPIPAGKKAPDPFKDSGLQFFIYKVPQQIKDLEYRLVVNGLWTTDPSNPRFKRDPVSGLNLSVIQMPDRPQKPNPFESMPNGVTFTFKGDPGENVTLAGTFNGWDPFMYEMRETKPGVYTITLPLASGSYQYVFFCKGQRIVDSLNPRRIYTRDKKAASVIDVP